MSERPTPATFEPHIGSAFEVRLADGRSVALVLEAVEDHADRDPQQPDALPPPFALLFRAPPDIVLDHGMHELESEALGILTIGLGPVVTVDRDRGVLHEAVFN